KEGVEEKDLLFRNQKGSLINPRQISRVKDRVVKKANMKGIPVHHFRHTHASLLLENGVSVKRVQERLGQAKPSITQDVYGFAIPRDENDDIAERFELLF